MSLQLVDVDAMNYDALLVIPYLGKLNPPASINRLWNRTVEEEEQNG